MPLLPLVVEALQNLSGSELEIKTAMLLEELRGGSAGADGAEFVAGLVGRVAAAPELRASSDQRRAFARFVDAAVELAGAEVCSPECCRLLLQSVAGVATKAESVVASEVLLGILGGTTDGGAWEAVWQSALAAPGSDVGKLLVAALERFPRAAYAEVCLRLRSEGAGRVLALELLCAVGMRETTIAESEPVLVTLPLVMGVCKEDKDGRAVASGLMAMTGLVRSVTRQALHERFDAVMDCVERGLMWSQPPAAAAAQSAAVSLFFCVYSALPSQAVKRMREWSARSPSFAVVARRMLATRSVPLHPGLLVAEEGSGDTVVDACWTGLLAGAAMPPVSLYSGSSRHSQHQLQQQQQQQLQQQQQTLHEDREEWKIELDNLESQLASLAVSVDALCFRGGIRSFPVTGVLAPYNGDDAQEVRSAAAMARIELVYERMLRAKTLMRIQQEGYTAGAALRGNGETGLSATDHDTTDTSENEVVEETMPAITPRPESTTSRLKTLLASARSELAVREQTEEALRKRVHQAEEALRAEETRSKAELAVQATDVDLTALTEEQEQRIGELEAQLRIATEHLRDQQQYESELAMLQHDVMEWDERDVTARARKQDGTDLASQLEAARAEIHTLEETMLESQTHYHQALSEVAGLTAVTNTAMADSLRSEREIEELRRTINKMTDAYQERIAAVEDKYVSLQELHATLLGDLSRRK